MRRPATCAKVCRVRRVPVLSGGIDTHAPTRSQADTLLDSSGLRVTFESPDEAARRGIDFKHVQIVEIGPRSAQMLVVPPGRDHYKVSSAHLNLNAWTRR